MSGLKKVVKAFLILGSISAISGWAQPTPAPTTGDAPCAAEPPTAGANDTISGGPDAEGYFSLFDGTFKGWWHSCQTGHSQGNPQGGIFRIGEENGVKAIYSTQRGDGIGGLLMTKKKFTNYEIVFDLWPDYNNDGGIFNRTDAKGRCFQTVLDYIGGASMGGTWGEGGFTSRDFRPFSFNGGENNLSIPGNGAGELSNWTTITSKLNPTSFGCPATGCTVNEYRLLWDQNNWNQFKIQFYGGHAPNTGTIHMKSWFRKIGAAAWVPVLQDTTLNQVVPAGYIGLQVHGGNRFTGPKGTWYKNIKWRPVTDKGEPIISVSLKNPAAAPKFGFSMKLAGSNLIGSIDQDYSILVTDVQGKTVQTLSGKAGNVNHVIASGATGWLNLQITTSQGVEMARVLKEAW